jgi:hypothetical protein
MCISYAFLSVRTRRRERSDGPAFSLLKKAIVSGDRRLFSLAFARGIALFVSPILSPS